MSDIEATLKSISECAARVGERRFAIMSGVPYTTFRDLLARDFQTRYLDNLKKLERTARANPAKQ